MNSSVILDQYVQIACLPPQSNIYPSEGLTGVIVGWGAKVYNGSNSNDLQNARLDIFSNSTCDSYGYSNGYPNNYTSAFCAGNFIIKIFN